MPKEDNNTPRHLKGILIDLQPKIGCQGHRVKCQPKDKEANKQVDTVIQAQWYQGYQI